MSENNKDGLFCETTTGMDGKENREWIDGQMIEGKASACINPCVVCTQSGIEGTQMLSGPDSDSEQGFIREREKVKRPQKRSDSQMYTMRLSFEGVDSILSHLTIAHLVDHFILGYIIL